MADWLEEVAKLLWKISLENPDLAKDIRLAVKRIERNPGVGRFIRDTRYVYTDPHERFRIGYNFFSKKNELEIVVLHIIR